MDRTRYTASSDYYNPYIPILKSRYAFKYIYIYIYIYIFYFLFISFIISTHGLVSFSLHSQRKNNTQSRAIAQVYPHVTLGLGLQISAQVELE